MNRTYVSIKEVSRIELPSGAAGKEARCQALRREITDLLQGADERSLRLILQFVSPLKQQKNNR